MPPAIQELPLQLQGYRSLFEQINFDDDKFHFVGYEGSLSDVLSSLEMSLATPETAGPLPLVLHPPRIVRAVLDWKVAHPEDAQLPDLLKAAVDLGLNIYGQQPQAVEELKRFKTALEDLGYRELLKGRLFQPQNLGNWKGMEAEKSAEAAQILENLADGEDVSLVPLAHGGTAPAMDVFLRYCSATGNQHSVIYPVRFSLYKLGDKQPRLTPAEILYLQELSVGRHIVLFDDTALRRETKEAAAAFFSRVFLGRTVNFLINVDVSWIYDEYVEKELKAQINHYEGRTPNHSHYAG